MALLKQGLSPRNFVPTRSAASETSFDRLRITFDLGRQSHVLGENTPSGHEEAADDRKIDGQILG